MLFRHPRAAASVPALVPTTSAVGVTALQAAVVVAGRLPQRGVAPPQGELEEPPQ
ncbi:hypothetical protein GYH30_050200 [Glycine max]|nr:hypothetical protein GYH30_050200 [Glycine max]